MSFQRRFAQPNQAWGRQLGARAWLLVPSCALFRVNLRYVLTCMLIGACTFAHAAEADNASRLAQPSEWIAQGFVPPSGEPKCIGEVVKSLNTAKLQTVCEAARNGVAQAQHVMGQLFFLSVGAQEHNYDDAYKWFNLAAEQGLAASQYGMGLLHLYNLGIVGQLYEAERWLSGAASSGHANAQLLMGLHTANPIRQKDSGIKEPLEWIRRSSEQGHPLALEVLTNVEKRMAQHSSPNIKPEGKFVVAATLAACTQGYDINNAHRTTPDAGATTSGGAQVNKPEAFVYFTEENLLEAIKESHLRYLGMVSVCFAEVATRSGPGFVPPKVTSP